MIETWKPVLGYEGLYEVSDLGRVRSLPRRTPAGGRGGKVLRPTKVRGYLYVDLRMNGTAKKRRVHRLVLEAFRGTAPEGMEACHFDGDRANCRLANPRWDTRSANALDRVRHGRHVDNSGERNGQAKLSATDIERIRDQRRLGRSQYVIARQFGVSRSLVAAIDRGERWAHADGARF